MAIHRSVGVEIEFAGLGVAETAQAVIELFGGELEERTRHALRVRGTVLGDFKIKLDTRFADKAPPDEPFARSLAESALNVADGVLPIEIVAPPVVPDSVVDLDRLLTRLAKAGGQGTRQSPASAFGVHLNPSLERLDSVSLHAWLTAFSLGFAWLEHEVEVNWTRHLLRFAEPYPEDYVQTLCRDPAPREVGTLIDTYLAANPTRNRALDMLPVFSLVDPVRIERALPGEPVSSRPTLHYRLPDSRVGQDPTWSLKAEWARWMCIARIATDPERLDELRQHFLKANVSSRSETWRKTSSSWFDGAVALAP